jgi:hypothetical protein
MIKIEKKKKFFGESNVYKLCPPFVSPHPTEHLAVPIQPACSPTHGGAILGLGSVFGPVLSGFPITMVRRHLLRRSQNKIKRFC